jgi:methionyl-tRNA formyltransferase
MRIVFFGSPEAALPALQGLLMAGHTIELVVTQPDKPAGRGKKLAVPPVKEFALSRSLPVYQPGRIRTAPGAPERLRAAWADIFVVVAYGQILPREIIDIPPYKTVNVHFSLLPRYRGAAPVQGALLNGETRTGVTIFRLNEKMDEGDILTRSETAILLRETAGELEARLADIGTGLLLETLARIDEIPLQPQDPTGATLAPKMRKEDGRLDWSREAGEVDRRVRAFSPRPLAFTSFKGQRLIVLKGAPLSGVNACGNPGTVHRIAKEGLEICCGGGTLYRIERLRPESRGAMDAYAFTLNGRVRAGELLG